MAVASVTNAARAERSPSSGGDPVASAETFQATTLPSVRRPLLKAPPYYDSLERINELPLNLSGQLWDMLKLAVQHHDILWAL